MLYETIIFLIDGSLNILLIIGGFSGWFFMYIQLSGFPISSNFTQGQSLVLDNIIFYWSTSRVIWFLSNYLYAFYGFSLINLNFFQSFSVAILYCVCEIFPMYLFMRENYLNAEEVNRRYVLVADIIENSMPNISHENILSGSSSPYISPQSPAFGWYVDPETSIKKDIAQQNITVTYETRTWIGYIYNVYSNILGAVKIDRSNSNFDFDSD